MRPWSTSGVLLDMTIDKISEITNRLVTSVKPSRQARLHGRCCSE